MDKLHYEQIDQVAVIRMDDGKANAIQDGFLSELEASLARAREEAAAVVLAGREGFFSAGLDLKTLPTLENDALHAVTRRFSRAMIDLFAFELPLVAAIGGHALAGGCVLALCADRRIAVQGDYKIGLNEVAIGLPLPTYVVEMARTAIHPGLLEELLLEARVMSPDEAGEAGLVDEIVASDPVGRAVEEAARLARLPTLAWSATKERLRRPAIERSEATWEGELERFLTSGPFGQR